MRSLEDSRAVQAESCIVRNNNGLGPKPCKNSLGPETCKKGFGPETCKSGLAPKTCNSLARSPITPVPARRRVPATPRHATCVPNTCVLKARCMSIGPAELSWLAAWRRRSASFSAEMHQITVYMCESMCANPLSQQSLQRERSSANPCLREIKVSPRARSQLRRFWAGLCLSPAVECAATVV